VKLSIRGEKAADREAVFEVHSRAFETQAEARLVDALREVADPFISLVAVLDGAVVGHVLFTPTTLPGGVDRGRTIGLAPLAVLPAHQNRGIGSRLVRAGLTACRNAGRDVVFVLGHEGFYPRFGFRPAAKHGFLYQGAENRHFMVVGLRRGAMNGMSGSVRFLPEFDRWG
jgi:putative acetyltransferase